MFYYTTQKYIAKLNVPSVSTAATEQNNNLYTLEPLDWKPERKSLRLALPYIFLPV